MEEVLAFFFKKRYYVVFNDGTWRTCEDNQWKEEQIWRRKDIKHTFWAGGECDVIAIRLLMERFNAE